MIAAITMAIALMLLPQIHTQGTATIAIVAWVVPIAQVIQLVKAVPQIMVHSEVLVLYFFSVVFAVVVAKRKIK